MNILKKNKEEIEKLIINGKEFDVAILLPNIADNIVDYAEFDLELGDIMSDAILSNRHCDALPPDLFYYGLISSKLKRLFSITDSVTSITSEKLMNEYSLNVTNKEFTTEGNMRKFINQISKCSDISEEEINEEIKNNKNSKENKKSAVSREEIIKTLKTAKEGKTFIDIFNNIMKKLVTKINKNKNEPSVYILDCVKIPVNLSNSNFELSTVINYEGKPMRGYKLGALRMVTDFGGVIVKLIGGTISDSDIKLVEDDIVNFELLKKGDYLIMDRGFVKIEFVKKLVEKGINVIIPLKKNMDAYKEGIEQIKSVPEEMWLDHPNSERKGQKILLLDSLKGTWLSDSEKKKKPEKIMKSALDFTGCIIRIDTTEKKNKKVIESLKKAISTEDETDILYEDNKYIYIIIASTNTELSPQSIVRYYEMRPEIEEDFRQLKDIWGICTITSTKYKFVMCHLSICILAYNLFVMFKSTEEGKKYINKSIKTIAKEEKKDFYPANKARYIVISGDYFYVYRLFELFKLFEKCDDEIIYKFQQFL